MSFRPLVATALVGALACGVVEARVTQQVNYTGWNGGTTIIGNMKGVNFYGGKRFTLNPNAVNLKIVAQPFYNTNKTGYGIIFERSSYNSVKFIDTTFLFHLMSTNSSMTAIYLKDNSLSLTLHQDSAEESANMLFRERISGRTSVAGFVAEKSNFALNVGRIVFQDVVESSNGVAYGFLSKGGITSRSFIQISDKESAPYTSAIVKFENTLQGREAYGIRFQGNAGENFLDIRQNAPWKQEGKEAGGIYFNYIKGLNGNAALVSAEGNTAIRIVGKSTLRANVITSQQSSTLIGVNRGNLNLTLENGASIALNTLTSVSSSSLIAVNSGNVNINLYSASRITTTDVSSGGEANGLRIVGSLSGYGNPSSYAHIVVRDGSNFAINRIYSNRSNVYGIQTDKNLTLESLGQNAVFGMGAISANMQGANPSGNAYGIMTDRAVQINATHGGQITFASIQGANAYGIFGNYGVTIRPQSNGVVAFNSIYAGGRQGEKAVGISSGRSVIITPEIGGRIVFENISSRSEASGIRVENSLTIDHTNDPYQSRKGSSTIFRNIQSQGHNAIGIYTPRTGLFHFKGGGRTTFERIEYTGEFGDRVYAAAGIVVDSYDTTLEVLGGHELAFNNIISYDDAFGMRVADMLNISVDNASLLKFGTIRANNTAYGLKTRVNATISATEGSRVLFSSLSGGGKSVGISASSIQASAGRNSSIRFESIASSNNIAIGLEANSVSLTANGNGQIYFKSITSDREANGIRVSNNLSVNLAGASSSDRIVFEQIRSQNGNAMGIYTYGNNANVSFSGSGSNVAFKSISHQGDSSNHFAGGIVSDGQNSTINVVSGNHLWFDSISSHSGNAYGIKAGSLTLNVDSSSFVHFYSLSAQNRAIGLWLNNGSNATIQGGGKIEFKNISSTGGDKLGIRAWESDLTINNTSLIFGVLNGSDKYGIFSKIEGLKHTFGNVNISVQGNNAKAIYGASNTSIDLQGGKTMTLSARYANGKEAMAIDGRVNLAMKGNNANLILNAGNGNIQRLDITSGSTINLVGTTQRSTSNLQLRKLTINSWNGSGANVLLYANGTASIDTTSFDGRAYQPSKNQAWVGGSDRIIINDTATTTPQNNTLKVALRTVDNPTKYVILAEVGGNAKDKVVFNELDTNQKRATIQTEVGFDIGNIEITRHDEGDKAYYVGKIPDKQSFRLNQQRARQVGATQNASSSVTSANFNNLNKRMGELRENSHAHGLWARVFNGEVESNFEDASLTNYTTIQAGYDYNLSSDANSNSYLGFALSYLNSKTSGVINETKGNGVEAGVYFAYVQDSGLYTDSILKLSYMSNTNSSSEYSLSDTTNTSFILSQEVGYEADVGAGFYLTPQFETTYAYLGGSSMTATRSDGSELKSTQDATNTWRNRLGLQASYKLKGENESFLASFYAMGSYTYDYISGGDITSESASNSEKLFNSVKSDGRFVLNVGSNIDIKDATRLYLDFEKSFGGKINTNYQINVGVRYSFGEKISK
ncbi:autotransporter outer membrane beta-barrel domain-containing protein [Helicobacter brantae]|uniref:Autotransporter domain-containing protein n=1 Tax=Helicobacter brantae TaxID=375927 RepID=A0A3D8J2I7_9HELI|nr:autotransporter outer membrane beta-barrel domain-containing protein [Helicobacter brantae]RDU71718.1 hypothetical protein CQA58_01385 [Helicobacter brantae]